MKSLWSRPSAWGGDMTAVVRHDADSWRLAHKGKAMNERGLAAGIFERDERRCKDRRGFTYTVYFPERRVCFDRRHRFPLYLVELEAEEIESLLELGNELR